MILYLISNNVTRRSHTLLEYTHRSGHFWFYDYRVGSRGMRFLIVRSSFAIETLWGNEDCLQELGPPF